MKILFFCLFILLLSATVNEPLRCEVFSGYRNDRIHWHVSKPFHYGELYRNIQFWENGLTLKVIHRDLTFFLRGSYGALANRWCADGVGYFGYAVNLTADRLYKVLFTPLIGYSAYFVELNEPYRQLWNGVFLGGAFTVETSGPLVLNAGYSYHFNHNNTHTVIDKLNSGGNKGHTASAQIDGKLNRLWRLGIGGQIHYFFTPFVDSEQFKLRWSSISGWAQLSREI